MAVRTGSSDTSADSRSARGQPSGAGVRKPCLDVAPLRVNTMFRSSQARIRSDNQSTGELVNLALVNALARRALRQHDEFSARDFLNLDRWLNAAGPPDPVYQVPLKQQLRYAAHLLCLPWTNVPLLHRASSNCPVSCAALFRGTRATIYRFPHVERNRMKAARDSATLSAFMRDREKPASPSLAG